MSGRRQLTRREQQLVRFGGVAVAIYLVLFFGIKFFEKRRVEYQKLVREARDLRQKIKPYETRVQVVKKLMDDFHMDPVKLNKVSLVADTSAAIQRAAKSGNIQLGPIRESPTHGSSKSIGSIQLEGSGPVPAMLKFLAGLDSIGFPVVVDTIEFSADKTRPGQVKVSMTLRILDFEQWKIGETPHA